MYGAPAQTPKSKTGLVAVIVIAILLVVGLIVFMMLRGGLNPGGGPKSTSSTGSTTTQAGTRTSVKLLKPGDCFEESATAASTYSYAWVVACTMAHDSEVFYSGNLPDGPYPSDSDVEAYVVDNCDPAFKDYVGIDYSKSKYDVSYIFAVEDGWNSGNHSIVCYVVDPAGDRTSSVKGTAK